MAGLLEPISQMIHPDIQGKLRREIMESASREGVNFVKGMATAPFTAAPDLLGMTRSLSTNPVSMLPGQQTGSIVPQGFSGNPVRGLAGLDPKSISGMLGEVADPTSGALKIGKAAAGLLSDAVRIAGPEVLAQTPKGLLAMTLFHGTPHKFNKFELSKIGTGEGAQAYGHGLYFAESPGVAKSYQSALSNQRHNATLSGGGESVELPDWLGRQIQDSDKGLDNAIVSWKQRAREERTAMADSLQPHLHEANANRLEREVAAMERIKASGKPQVEIPEGHLYEVDIPDEITDRMLDWDAPLSDLPEAAKPILGDTTEFLGQRQREAIWDEVMLIANNDEKIYRAWTGPDGEFTERVGDLLNRLVDGKSTAADSAEINSLFRGSYRDYVDDYGGSNFLESLERRHGATIGDAIEAAGKSPELTMQLREAGIPGIRFFDGSSRSAQEGTRNIVVFNPDDITQVKRDGELVFSTK